MLYKMIINLCDKEEISIDQGVDLNVANRNLDSLNKSIEKARKKGENIAISGVYFNPKYVKYICLKEKEVIEAEPVNV